MRRKISLSLWIAGISAGFLFAQGPDPGRMALELAKVQNANDKLMRAFSWKTRIEIKKKGETQAVKLDQVRYNLDGKLERTPMSDDTKKIKKKSREWWQGIATLARSYMHPSAGTLVDFFQKAKFQHGTGKMEGTVKITGSAFLNPNDTIRLWVDATTNKFRKMEFFTTLEKDSVNGAIEYKVTPEGLYYPVRTYVQIPNKKVEAIVETFDLIEQN